jgi:predicted transposase YbfD/YdcC
MYRQLYIDGFVAAMQCETLRYCLKPIGNQNELVEQNDTIAGSTLLICHDNYMRNDQDFIVKDNQNYNYRAIQKDSMRCLLLLIPINIKKFILNNQ